MKPLFLLLLCLCALPAFSQEYPFERKFMAGTIMLKDSSQKTGQIKWFVSPVVRLQFRENEEADIDKYSPDELLGFTSGGFKFIALFNFKAYLSDYALLGKMETVKHTFGELIDTGKFNIYFLSLPGYNAVAQSAQTYHNFLFEKKVGNTYQYAAYPFLDRMKNKRYEQAKEDLYVFFKDYPAIIEKIKAFKKEDNFLEIIKLMKEEN